ncbi:MAG: site-specific integrase, partial [Lachnospiraceae bacterium]|nr:site-specific integrase [Lachnospiraceae bacterium]
MSHNYKLTDFNIVENMDTDIHERIVSIDLSKIKELPAVIVERLEMMINKMISDYEQEHSVTIPTDNAELGMCMDVDTQEHTLSLNAYVGYSLDEECITGKEVMTADDEDYFVIKKYFFNELNTYIFEQIQSINPCFDIRVPTENKKVKRRFLSVEEQNIFLKQAKQDGDWYFEMFCIMFLTGIRVGELGGLQWSDVDFEQKCIRINRSLSCQYEQGVKKMELTTPKTHNSYRTIPFMGEAEEMFLAQKKKQE